MRVARADPGAYVRAINAARSKFIGSQVTSVPHYVHAFRPSERLSAFGRDVAAGLKDAFKREFSVAAYRVRKPGGGSETTVFALGSFNPRQRSAGEELVKEISERHNRPVPLLFDAAELVSAEPAKAADFLASRFLHNRHQMLVMRKTLLKRFANERSQWDIVREMHDPTLAHKMTLKALREKAAAAVETVFKDLEGRGVLYSLNRRAHMSRKGNFINDFQNSLPTQVAAAKKRTGALGSLEEELAKVEAALKRMKRQ